MSYIVSIDQFIEKALDMGYEIVGLPGNMRRDTALEKLKGLAVGINMDEGRWREAVGECRGIIETLNTGEVKDEDGKTIGVKTAINNLLRRSGFSKTNVTSFRILIEQLSSFSSLVHHTTVNGKVVEEAVLIEREDALFTVTTLTTILNLLSRKFQKQLLAS